MAGALKPGVVLAARFELTQRLGAGSSGVVWSAEDHEGDRRVALKILHPQLGRDPNLVQQLAREAKVLASLDHPHLARAICFADDGEYTFLAMELLEGEPLHERLGRHTREGRAVPLAELTQLIMQMCAGVAHAHAHEIVHRDLKPQNVIVATRSDGSLDTKVVDFGIARLAAASLFDATTLGRRMGSLFYMSPEQTRGEPVDARADVFALGSIFFEMLTLHRAWACGPQGPLPAFDKPIGHGEYNSIAAVFSRIVEGPRPRPRAFRPDLPEAFDLIVARALAVDAQVRYPNVAAFVNEARAALDGLGGPIDLASTTTGEAPTLAPPGPDDRTVGALAGRPLTPTRALGAPEDPRLSNVPVEQVDLRRPEPKSLALSRTAGPLVAPTLPFTEGGEPGDAARPMTEDLPPAPLGPEDDLVETGPTVRQARPETAAVGQEPPASAPSTPSAHSAKRRIAAVLALVGGAALGTLLILAVTSSAPAPAPLAEPIDVSPARRARTEPVRHPELLDQLGKVRAHPEDRAGVRALTQSILQAATELEDKEAAAEIVVLARRSEARGDIPGLAKCIARLEASTP